MQLVVTVSDVLNAVGERLGACVKSGQCANCRFKLELESQLQSKHNELSRWEAELKGDKDKMASLQSQLTKLGAELRTERDKADQLQSLLHEATGRQIALQGQKDALQQRVDQVRMCAPQWCACVWVGIVFRRTYFSKSISILISPGG